MVIAYNIAMTSGCCLHCRLWLVHDRVLAIRSVLSLRCLLIWSIVFPYFRMHTYGSNRFSVSGTNQLIFVCIVIALEKRKKERFDTLSYKRNPALKIGPRMWNDQWLNVITKLSKDGRQKTENSTTRYQYSIWRSRLMSYLRTNAWNKAEILTKFGTVATNTLPQSTQLDSWIEFASSSASTASSMWHV